MTTRRIRGLACSAFCLLNISLLAHAQNLTPASQPTLAVPVSAESMGSIHQSLQRLFLGRTRIDPANNSKLEIQAGASQAILEFQTNQQRVTITGTVELSRDLGNILVALAAQSDGLNARVLPLNDNGQMSLSSAMVTSAATGRSSATTPMVLPRFLGLRRAQLASMQQGSPGAVDPARNPQQQMPAPIVQPNNAAAAANAPPANGGPAPTALPLPQFEGVQIEMLPEIDAIIIRGRDQQLAELSEIIKRLDEASRLVRPEIEVLPLQHTNSQPLADLIEKSQPSLTGAQQGRITVTPLGKPNALLLIGWGEAFTATKELIAKLDVPSEPNAQFAVIQLKHAIANDLQTQLQTFFRNRQGLGPVIQSMVDNRSNAIVVHASPADLLEIRSLIEQLDVPRGGMVHQARVFVMRYSLAADVAKALQAAIVGTGSNRNNPSLQLLDEAGRPIATSGILDASQITVNERNNSIVISSAAENLPLIEKLIEQLDTPGTVAKIKIFPIKNGDAGALVETLRSLLVTQSASGQSSPQLSNAPDESSLIPLRFTVDARGNNVIAVGSEGDLKIVEALIIRLDETGAAQRKSTVYRLKNSPAVDVALAINEFLRGKRQVEIAAPGSNNPFEQLEKEVVVVPEPVQNKLILSATPRYYDEISNLIEQLDQQPPQVMIQVMIAEITLGNVDEFGVELGLQDSVLFDRSLLGGLLTRTNTTNTSTPAGVVTETTQEIVAATNVPGFNFNSGDPLGNSGSSRALARSNRVGSQGISNFSVGRTNDALGFGGLVLSASSESVSFLLRALQDSRRLEILSRPQVLTLDNQQAFIQVGQRVPRIATSIINQNGAQNSIVMDNVGLIIGVTPRISPEGVVVMEIDAEKSKLGPESEGIPVSISTNGTVIRSPRVDTITAQATVSAADGETIILGGLISRSTRTQHRQVPWLGSLPVLKHLFSYDFNEALRSELLIIMTPHVVRSQGDMERLKQAEFARMSWCEADVFDVHGDVYPPTDLTAEVLQQQPWNVIYPDVDPRGITENPEPSTGFPDTPMNRQLKSDWPKAEGLPWPAPSSNAEPVIGEPLRGDPANYPVGYARPLSTAWNQNSLPQVGITGAYGSEPNLGLTNPIVPASASLPLPAPDAPSSPSLRSGNMQFNGSPR